MADKKKRGGADRAGLVRLRLFGFGATSFLRFAREGWWARQGSNL
jgi:hypothetical protein